MPKDQLHGDNSLGKLLRHYLNGTGRMCPTIIDPTLRMLIQLQRTGS